MEVLHNRARDRHPARPLRLIAGKTADPPRWTDRQLAELVELAYTLGRRQERDGLTTWRERASFPERVAIMVASFEASRNAARRHRRSAMRATRRSGRGGGAA